eukprot:GHVU01133490.1.p2 GENE.GHVU01133490.1~~GHVU01133490.1.p2  ORF type:complete len:113 (+),score=4.13 GHVU01133490.1:1744-2082(+)
MWRIDRRHTEQGAGCRSPPSADMHGDASCIYTPVVGPQSFIHSLPPPFNSRFPQSINQPRRPRSNARRPPTLRLFRRLPPSFPPSIPPSFHPSIYPSIPPSFLPFLTHSLTQ